MAYFFFKKLPSLNLLLKTLFFLPFPRFNPAYVGLNESQLGQMRRRLLSVLFRQFPSMWSATRGTLIVFGLISAHPHKTHLSPNLFRKYFLIFTETVPKL